MDRGGDGSGLELQKQQWARTQDVLKGRLVLEDDFEWSLPSVSSNSDQSDARGKLKYIGGVDISFLKEDPSTACAAVVVLDADTLEIVHEEFDVVRMQVPYIPGFLAFRELHHVDGLDQSEVRKQLEAKGNCNKECISLTGQSGKIWGAAMRSSPGSLRPIYISVGHRISLNSAIGIVKYCCRYRVPEPTRQADIRSKVFLQKHQRL